MTDDRLIERLKGLCMRFDADPLLGRYEVAKQSTLNEQYLYQVLTGKPMANGNKRSLGKIARGKITKAFPDWLDPGVGDGPLNPLEAQLVTMYRKLPESFQDALLQDANKYLGLANPEPSAANPFNGVKHAKERT